MLYFEKRLENIFVVKKIKIKKNIKKNFVKFI